MMFKTEIAHYVRAKAHKPRGMNDKSKLGKYSNLTLSFIW